MKTSSQYRAMARETLAAHWSEAALTMLVFMFIACVCSAFSGAGEVAAIKHIFWLQPVGGGVSFVLSVLVLMPLEYALLVAVLHLVRGGEGKMMDDMFSSFRLRYVPFLESGFIVMIVVIATSIITLGIWGVIMAYAYRMVPFLLRDYPSLSPKEALETSRRMMKGYKWDLFVLDLSFIGWILLSILSCCIGFLWLGPYMYTATAHFYEELKAERLEEI